MGASSSAPRTLTMKNDEPHIIEVTSDVINRIKHGYPSHQQQQTPPSSADATSQTSAAPSNITNQDEAPSKQAMTTRDRQEQVALSVGASGHEVLETVSALQVRKEKDEELLANDFFWRTKLKELEGRYVASAFASEQEFQSELENLQTLMPKRRQAVCDEISPKITACYAANPKQVLKCSDLVQEFARCVDKNLGQSLQA